MEYPLPHHLYCSSSYKVCITEGACSCVEAFVNSLLKVSVVNLGSFFLGAFVCSKFLRIIYLIYPYFVRSKNTLFSSFNETHTF